MTPAIDLLVQKQIWHRVHGFDDQASAQGFAMSAAESLQVDPARVFKTLMANEGQRFACALVPANATLNLKRAAKSLGWKKLSMAEPKAAERISGYLVGGISALGQKRQLPTLLDESAERHESIFISAGRRGLDLEIKPQDLQSLGLSVESIADFGS